MPVTFGSVGDIISVALLIKDLVQALDKSRGSQAEYRQLIQELGLLEDVLRKVDRLCTTSGTSGFNHETEALHQTALHITDGSRKLVQRFTAKLVKYNKTLGTASTEKSNAIHSTFAKVRWQVGEKDEVARFRAEIAGQATSLNILLNTTTWGVGKDTQQILRTMESKSTERFNNQTNALSNIVSKISETNTSVDQAKTISGSILSSLSKLGDLCTQVKSVVLKALLINMATYKAVLALQNSSPTHIERSLINEPFILEDAIGRMSPVHLQFISSWAAFEAVLETRFRGIQGYGKVIDGHWTLQDHATGRDISRKSCWEGTFLPGQRVDMSLLFERETTVDHFDVPCRSRSNDDSDAACPRCQADVSEVEDTDVQCSSCGLCFRRITEVHETTPEPTPQRPNHWESKPAFGKPSFQPTFGPARPSNKRQRNAVDDLDVSSFKRIRIHSKLKMIRRHVFISPTHKSNALVALGIRLGFHPQPRAAPSVLTQLGHYREAIGREEGTVSTDDYRDWEQNTNTSPKYPFPQMHREDLRRDTIRPSVLLMQKIEHGSFGDQDCEPALYTPIRRTTLPPREDIPKPLHPFHPDFTGTGDSRARIKEILRENMKRSRARYGIMRQKFSDHKLDKSQDVRHLSITANSIAPTLRRTESAAGVLHLLTSMESSVVRTPRRAESAAGVLHSQVVFSKDREPVKDEPSLFEICPDYSFRRATLDANAISRNAISRKACIPRTLDLSITVGVIVLLKAWVRTWRRTGKRNCRVNVKSEMDQKLPPLPTKTGK